MTRKYLLMVSGGPDSIYLLVHYHKEALAVVHVNYHKRSTSDEDEVLAKALSEKYKVAFHSLDVDSTTATNNFQAWARKVRYDFAVNVCQKVQCSAILTAHHKDDFIETGIMQLQSNRTPRQFGIAKSSLYQQIEIYRPLLKESKKTIINFLNKKQIAYAIDESNAQLIFERNRVRAELEQLNEKEKNQRYQWLIMANRILRKKNRRVDAKAAKWEKTAFNLNFWKTLRRDRIEVLFQVMHQLIPDLNLTNAKLTSLAQFLDTEDTSKKFIVNQNWAVQKTNFRLSIIRR